MNESSCGASSLGTRRTSASSGRELEFAHAVSPLRYAAPEKLHSCMPRARGRTSCRCEDLDRVNRELNVGARRSARPLGNWRRLSRFPHSATAGRCHEQGCRAPLRAFGEGTGGRAELISCGSFIIGSRFSTRSSSCSRTLRRAEHFGSCLRSSGGPNGRSFGSDCSPRWSSGAPTGSRVSSRS